MISVADIDDVITARDTYREPISKEEAIDELRRSAGTQLDARFVEAFIGVLERRGIAFTHTEDSDFEAELAMEERVRDLASPRHRSGEPQLEAAPVATPERDASGNVAPEQHDPRFDPVGA